MLSYPIILLMILFI